MEEIQKCNICGQVFTGYLQIIRAALVIKHYAFAHPGEDPTKNGNVETGMNPVMDQPTDQVEVS